MVRPVILVLLLPSVYCAVVWAWALSVLRGRFSMMKLCAPFLVFVFRFAISCKCRWSCYKVPACSVGVALVSLVFPLLAGTAKAVQVDNKWTGATSANWSDTGNWSAGHVPTSAETVRFDNASTANLNTIVNACAPGDLNCDGTVDAGDY